MFKATALTALCGMTVLAQTSANSNSADAPKQFLDPPKQVFIQSGTVAAFGPVGITAALAGPMSTIAGAPYSAQTMTERIQVLADGNRIDQTATGSVARDSQGRVRREESLPGLGSNTPDAPHLVLIDDPVAGVHWNLDPLTKTATKMPFALPKASIAAGSPAPPPIGPDKTFFYSSAVPDRGPGIQIMTRSSISASDANSVKTDLGTQNFEGVAAQGTRVTRTLPAGSVDNELPIVITTETWYSPELKVLVMSKTNDPRMGETTYKLTNIQRAEPAASLFQVPADYTIKDQPVNTFFFRESKKNEKPEE